MASERAAYLVEQFSSASNALIQLAERIPVDRWLYVAAPGEWSPGKDAEHVADGNALHQWDARSALGQPVGKRPGIDRTRLTARLPQPDVIGLLRLRARESGSLVAALTDQQLALPCRTRTLDEFIERVLIRHYRTHQLAIERKLARAM